MDKPSDGQGRRRISPVPVGPEVTIPEHVIKRNIVTYLRYNGVFCWVQYNGAVWDAKNRSFRRHAYGQRKGVSDILGVWRGKLLAIEVKAQDGKLSEYQEEFLKEVNTAGGIAFVARSVDDVIKELNAR